MERRLVLAARPDRTCRRAAGFPVDLVHRLPARLERDLRPVDAVADSQLGYDGAARQRAARAEARRDVQRRAGLQDPAVAAGVVARVHQSLILNADRDFLPPG